KWFVKDTTISGVLAALGKYGEVGSDFPACEIKNKMSRVFREFKGKINTSGLDLAGFTRQYNLLSSRSVNIGIHIRKVIMQYTLRLLEGKDVTWDEVFLKNTKSS